MSTIFTLEKIFKAYKDCQKGKKNSINALKFEINRERNLLDLLSDLQDGTYKVSRHICFIVTHPTPREIFAADFRDRIVHHLLYREIYDLFDMGFIPHSYANRRGKGTHAAVNELRKNIQRVKSKTGGGFYLKLDVQSFFRTINKDILFRLIEDKVELKSNGIGSQDDSQSVFEILWLCKKIIYDDPTKDFVYKGDPRRHSLIPKKKSLFTSEGAGLPIGNLTSQFFANIYLNELDHFITEKLGCIQYVRYVDDFVMVDSDQRKLRSFVKPINEFLEVKLDLGLHPHKICMQNVSKGIDFLGYYIKPTHTLVRQKVVKRLKNRLYTINKEIKKSENIDNFQLENLQTIAECSVSMINSYYGHFAHANSFRLRKHIFDCHLGKLKEKLTVDAGYGAYRLKENNK